MKVQGKSFFMNGEYKSVGKKANVPLKYSLSALAFVLNGGATLAFMFLILYLNNPGKAFLQADVSTVFYVTICLAFIYAVIYIYYMFECKEFFLRVRNSIMLLTILDISVVASYFLGRYVSLYARPVALTALLILFLRTRKEAVFMNFVEAVVLLVLDVFSWREGLLATEDVYSSFVVSFVGGMIAIFMCDKLKTRFAVLVSGFALSAALVFMIFMFNLSTSKGDIGTSILSELGYGIIGGMASVIAFIICLPFYEIAFGVFTIFRLRELTGADMPLLRRLHDEAPGTYEHSLTVAQLAEGCAAKLGENSALARAAAYYHDVGKLSHPEYFTENIPVGTKNPHDDLSPEASVAIIRSHTRAGYSLIRKNGLPEYFADIAISHHGTLPIKYFYNKAMKLTDGNLNIEDYSYSDKKPQDKIAAIIMIADAAEAAVRSLPDKSPDNVERIIRSIIEERIDLNQFSECDITMRELNTIKDALVVSLTKGIYHGRVSYPDLKFKRN